VLNLRRVSKVLFPPYLYFPANTSRAIKKIEVVADKGQRMTQEGCVYCVGGEIEKN